MSDNSLIISFLTVFCKNCIGSPDVFDDCILILRVVKAILDHFEIANGVNKETSVDSVDVVVRDSSVGQGDSVDAVSSNGVFVSWFDDDVRDIKVAGVLKGLVDPVLHDFGVHGLRLRVKSRLVGVGLTLVGGLLSPIASIDIAIGLRLL
jgi:hypothetical protein